MRVQAAGGAPSPDDEDDTVDPEPVRPPPEPELYTGKREFAVQFEGEPALLQIKPPRLNLLRKVMMSTRVGRACFMLSRFGD